MTDERDPAAELLEQAMTSGNVKLPEREYPFGVEPPGSKRLPRREKTGPIEEQEVRVVRLGDIFNALAAREASADAVKEAVLRTWRVKIFFPEGATVEQVKAHRMFYNETGASFVTIDSEGEEFLSCIVSADSFIVTDVTPEPAE